MDLYILVDLTVNFYKNRENYVIDSQKVTYSKISCKEKNLATGSFCRSLSVLREVEKMGYKKIFALTRIG